MTVAQQVTICLAMLLVTAALVTDGFAETVVQGLHGFEKFRCHGSIIEAGDARDEVLEKCGEPAWLDSRVETVYREERGGILLSVLNEEWIYDFGHDQLLEFLRFRDGRLVTIHSGNFGFGGLRNGDCGYGNNLTLGDSRLEVVAKCGEPTIGGTGDEKIEEVGDSPEKRRAVMAMNEWTYNFGPDRYVYYLTFRHGRVMEIRYGGFGR